MRNDQPVRYVEHDLPFVPEFAEDVVHEPQVGGAHGHLHVLLRDEVVEFDGLLSRDRMRLSHDAHHAVAQQFVRADRVRMVQAHADGKVDFVALQGVDGLRRRQMQYVESDARRRATLGDELRQQHAGEYVRHTDSERPLGGLGIESGIALQDAFDLTQKLTERIDEFQRARGRLHSGGSPNEKFVCEHSAQATECIAHRGLTEPNLFRGLCNVALGQERFQRHQKIQVDRSKIHGSSTPLLIQQIM
jgi:hypothetical protein